MPAIRSHPLVKADLHSAFDWYEDEAPGLGNAFGAEFGNAYLKLQSCPLLYAVRFSGIRRLNLQRFDYGIYYVVNAEEIRVLAVLHASRETRRILSERRRSFLPP